MDADGAFGGYITPDNVPVKAFEFTAVRSFSGGFAAAQMADGQWYFLKASNV